MIPGITWITSNHRCSIIHFATSWTYPHRWAIWILLQMWRGNGLRKREKRIICFKITVLRSALKSPQIPNGKKLMICTHDALWKPWWIVLRNEHELLVTTMLSASIFRLKLSLLWLDLGVVGSSSLAVSDSRGAKAFTLLSLLDVPSCGLNDFSGLSSSFFSELVYGC